VIFKLVARTDVAQSRSKLSPNGTKSLVFNERFVSCYELGDNPMRLWSRDDLSIVDCGFVGDDEVLISLIDDPPTLLSALEGSDIRSIERPVRTTLRTRFGPMFSHSDGRVFLRTSYPFQLVELEKGTLRAVKSISAESVSNVVFHPKFSVFAGVVDAAAQEVVFGSFESSPFFCNSSLYALPYIHSLGVSSSGRWLHILGSDGEQMTLVSIDLATREVVGRNSIDLEIEKTLSLDGNDEQVFVVPKVVPVVGETRVVLFQSNGNAIVIDSAAGIVEQLDTPHDVAVCSVSQAHRTGAFISSDWTGGVVHWNLLSDSPEQYQSWDFMDEDHGVSGSYEARPVRLTQ